MLKLYYAPKTRSTRVRWALEELQVPYELVRLNLKKGEHQTEEHGKRHPHRKVPVLTDGQVTIFESGAICTYLADRYPEKRLSPPLTSELRAAYYQWLFYGSVTLDSAVVRYYFNTLLYPPEKRSPSIAEEAREKSLESAHAVNQALTGKIYLVGETFSMADIIVGSCLILAQHCKLLDDFPRLQKYVADCVGRPAYLKATHD